MPLLVSGRTFRYVCPCPLSSWCRSSSRLLPSSLWGPSTSVPRACPILNAVLAVTGIAFHWASEWLYASPDELLLGSLLGAALFYAVRAVYLRLRGVEALGLGDVKFMAAAGLWVGIWGIAPLILIAALAALAVVLIRHGRSVASEAVRRRRIPFGPGLALGLIVVVGGRSSASGRDSQAPAISPIASAGETMRTPSY